jgi:hypothetical protein
MEFDMSFPLRLKSLLFLCLAATLAVVGGNPAYAQTHSEDLSPIHFHDWSGYIDGKGELVILPRFESAGHFDDNGLASVKEKGKWGYIDKAGQYVIPPRFDFAWRFADNGLARVEEKGKYGFIDKAGAFVIPPRFDDAGHFLADNGLAPAKENGKWGYIDPQGKFVIPPRFDFA